MLDVLRQQVRRDKGRGAEPSVGIIDSQSVKAADNVGRDTRGYDVGEKGPQHRALPGLCTERGDRGKRQRESSTSGCCLSPESDSKTNASGMWASRRRFSRG